MAPDINTLPTSRPPSVPGSPLAHRRPRRISLAGTDSSQPNPPSPRSPTLSSLQAAATINAGLHRAPSSASPIRNQGLERRRSSLLSNSLGLNDPCTPAPGEMQTNRSASGSPRSARRSVALSGSNPAGATDPHHARLPSLGQLHQELEQENEAQVNRLLYMIRLQQDQLSALQTQQQQQQQHPLEPTPPPDRPSSRSNSTTAFPFRPNSLSRQSSSRLSHSGSHASSPALRPSSTASHIGPHVEDFLLGGARDESAFYRAETQTLTRENQMLKARIRELERQVADMGDGIAPAYTPAAASPLASPPATFSGETAATLPAAVDPGAKD